MRICEREKNIGIFNPHVTQEMITFSFDRDDGSFVSRLFKRFDILHAFWYYRLKFCPLNIFINISHYSPNTTLRYTKTFLRLFEELLIHTQTTSDNRALLFSAETPRNFLKKCLLARSSSGKDPERRNHEAVGEKIRITRTVASTQRMNRTQRRKEEKTTLNFPHAR